MWPGGLLKRISGRFQMHVARWAAEAYFRKVWVASGRCNTLCGQQEHAGQPQRQRQHSLCMGLTCCWVKGCPASARVAAISIAMRTCLLALAHSAAGASLSQAGEMQPWRSGNWPDRVHAVLTSCQAAGLAVSAHLEHSSTSALTQADMLSSTACLAGLEIFWWR